MDGWRHLGRAEKLDGGGQISLYFNPFRPSEGYKRCTPVCTPHYHSLSPIGRGFDTAYRDACTIGNAFFECRTRSVLRHDYPLLSSFDSPPAFFKSAFVFFIYRFLYTITIV